MSIIQKNDPRLTDRERLLLSIGIPKEQAARANLRLVQKANKPRAQAEFSTSLVRMLRDDAISQRAFDKAKEICNTIEALESGGIQSSLNPDRLISSPNRGKAQIPLGYTDRALSQSTKVRNWQAVAGDMWPALVAVCVFGMSMTDAAKVVKKRKGFVSASIKHVLEAL